MRIYLQIFNLCDMLVEEGNFDFNVTSSYAPSNLWIIKENTAYVKSEVTGGAVPDENGRTVLYRKIVAVSEGRLTFKDTILFGTFVTLASSDYSYLVNLAINVDSGDYAYYGKQFDSNLKSYSDYQMVDLDELRTIDGYANLSTSECFAKLIDSNAEVGCLCIANIGENKDELK